MRIPFAPSDWLEDCALPVGISKHPMISGKGSKRARALRLVTLIARTFNTPSKACYILCKFLSGRVTAAGLSSPWPCFSDRGM